MAWRCRKCDGRTGGRGLEELQKIFVRLEQIARRLKLRRKKKDENPEEGTKEAPGDIQGWTGR